MRCHICDSELSEVHFNSDHEDIEPCPTCIMAIEDILASYEDRPSVDEDELFEEEDLSRYSLLLADELPPDE